MNKSVGCIAVSIAAFQVVDPGSTPGHRRLLNILSKHLRFLYSLLRQNIFP